MTSRFLKKVAQPVTRFLSRHRTINRIVRKIPIMTKFMAFFVPDELALNPPELAPEPDQLAPIAPIYNHRARTPKGPRLG